MSISAIGRATIGGNRGLAATTALAGALLLVAVATVGAKGKPGGGGGVSHTAVQTAPIELGTSGGWRHDLANGYCCGGTLGALVSIGETPYILSNWHVLAADTAPGGNNRVAEPGDFIIQPGLIDVRCNASSAQNVGTLLLGPSPTGVIPGTPRPVNVDAAIAAAVPGSVRSDGAILEIGPLSDQPLAAAIGLPVKKSGRTTGLTRSSITDVYATVPVAYENECAGEPAFTKTYTNQILVKNRGSRFLNSGDSGSLLVEDVDPYPRAIGLLFAGSSTVAVANRIDEVLETVGKATLVGVPAVVGSSSAAPFDLEAEIERAHAAQLRHARTLEQVPDAVGHAVGLGPDGRIAIKVLLGADSPRARAMAPRSLDGVPVAVEVVGKIVAY